MNPLPEPPRTGENARPGPPDHERTEPAVGDVVLPVARPRRPHPGFWAAVAWCVGFLIVTQVPGAVVSVGLAEYRMWSALPHARGTLPRFRFVPPTPEVLRQTMLPAMVVTEILVVGFSLAVIRAVVGRDWRRRLAVRLPGAAQVVLVLLAAPAFGVVGGGIHELAQALPSFKDLGLPGVQEFMEDIAGWPLGLAVLVIAVGPGIGEELWCRGFLGRGLVGRYGPVVGVLLTSLFFGLIHVDPPHAVAAACMGIGLHFVYLMTRSIWASMLLHFLNNSIGVLSASESASQFPVLGWIDRAGRVNPVLTYAASGLVLATAAWALFLGRARLVPTEGPGSIPWYPDYPGVAYPPAGTTTRVVRPWLGWVAWVLVAAALAVFAVAIYLA